MSIHTFVVNKRHIYLRSGWR